ncbi:FAD-dependent oxidoreductase [Nonomuraea sp. MCN248]|uniref:FAD-dependent oxidoreductase n=1 Tax=Nonomuraea corallina TaxID=2989783 RepID=A0ABT4SLB1_9ACTN|nr:FAD-dependent oxidoreductase [Nonomuraea corallina]MDA0637770.1 FAD-dependent oxidoreductase [Nonomuraea corallina]
MDVIVGGGIVGLSIAWRLARRGREVVVVDPSPATGASYAAAGMLAPISEVTYTEEPLLRLGAASLRRWPAFAAALAADAGLTPSAATGFRADEQAGDLAGAAFAGLDGSGDGAHGQPAARTGADGQTGATFTGLGDAGEAAQWLAAARAGLDLREDGTLDVAFGSDDLAMLDEQARFMEKLGLPVERLTGRECRRLEPMLAPSVRGGLLARTDAWVDPRRVTAALLAALDRLGVPVVRARVRELLRDGGRVVGVRLAPPEPATATLAAERVVLAAGAWSGELAEVPVRPVKGQIMRLRSPQPLLGRCVRGSVHGTPVYLVPRGDGELVVGATQEELGFDTRVTAGGVYELLRDARELVPGVTELEVADVVAGLRPGTPDNLPVIGPSGTPGLLLATGHHRGGVLLAPLTAAILEGEETGLATLCSPARFRDVS